jgi:transposase
VLTELVYDPPYHSRYNPIQRYWGILESHWNDTIPSAVPVALKWAVTMK